MSAPVMVLGIGNILLRDEGVGVRAIEAMQSMSLPPDVELLDGGTCGADLVDEIASRHKLIVIDAVKTDAPAGAIFRLTPDQLLHGDQQMSLHEFGMMDTLAMARTLGCPPREVVIFGVQPEVVEYGLELSDTVKACLPRLIQAVLKEAADTHPAPRPARWLP